MKKFSWNQQQFNEYLYKSHQYEMNNNFKTSNSPTNFASPLYDVPKSKNENPVNKQEELDNFYCLPGIPLSDESPTNLILIENNEDLFTTKLNLCNSLEGQKLSNETPQFTLPKDTFNAFNLNSSTLLKLDEKDCIDPKCNLLRNKPSVPMNASFNSLQKAYITAAFNLKNFMESIESSKSNSIPSLLRQTFDNISQVDKAVQTLNGISNKLKVKKSNERSSQTRSIGTKNSSVSTDAVLLNTLLENHSKGPNKSTNKHKENSEIQEEKLTTDVVKTHIIDAELSVNSPSSVIWPLKFEPLKYSQTKVPNLNKKKKKNPVGIKRKSKSTKAFLSHNSESENESLIGNDSNLDELTVISKSNSKFASFNDILENLGIHLQNSGASLAHVCQKKQNIRQNKDNNFNSFWDNPLEKFELVHSENRETNRKGFQSKLQEYSAGNTNENLDESHYQQKLVKIEIEDSKAAMNEKDEEKSLKMLTQTKPVNRENRLPTMPLGSNINRKMNFMSTSMKFSKSFYLNPYDDMVKSHLNSADRRIKSVASKNGSVISIEGPSNVYESQSQNLQTKSKMIYRCTISSSNSENLDKCINYLKETFPNTYLCNGVKTVFK